MKQEYNHIKFSAQSLKLLAIADSILTRYSNQGLDLTLRQLYYQFVATEYDALPESWTDKETGSKNNEKSYKKLGDLVSNGRLAGYLDWDTMTDRGRNVNRLAMWRDPVHRLESAARTHRLDKWSDQPVIVFAMIEKKALEGVLAGICDQLEIPYIANGGYSSSSTMHEIGRELMEWREASKEIHVLYLGDHDPSGIQMTDDVKTRLELFSEGDVYVHRLALNKNQVERYNPPPNPAKQTDSRFATYVKQYGRRCWELDALTPTIIRDLVRDAVLSLRDDDIWEESLIRQSVEKSKLSNLASRVRQGKIKLEL